jgi:hypothetical protein
MVVEQLSGRATGGVGDDGRGEGGRADSRGERTLHKEWRVTDWTRGENLVVTSRNPSALAALFLGL